MADVKGNGNNGGQKTTSNRGFASMSPEQQREIASKGGQAAHRQGVAHEWTSEEARIAGRKGGQASRGGGRSRTSAKPDENESGIRDNVDPQQTPDS